jgi:predicted P-loop ATPase
MAGETMTPTPITFFKSVTTKDGERGALTLHQLADIIVKTEAPTKKDLPLLKFSKFGDLRTADGMQRNNENVIEIDGVEGDYDGGLVTYESIVDKVQGAGITALVHTTPSHTPAAPRIRILCPTSKPLPTTERVRLVDRLNVALGGILARESWTLSQAFYFGRLKGNPAHYACVIEGKSIDECLHLDAPVNDNVPATVAPKKSHKAKVISTEALRSILAALPAKDFATGSAWRGLACSISDATGHTAEACGLFATWSASDPAFGAAGAAAANDWWTRLKDERPKGITAGSLVHILTQRGIAHLLRKRDGEKINWRERTPYGQVAKSMHNAALAITDLGIKARHDLFRDIVTIGFIGDEVQHDVAPLVGELSDNTMMALRGIISDSYGVDMGDQAIFDAVKKMALQNAFDPVLDTLDAAQALWEADRVPRIDTMLRDYFSAADTPLIRAQSSIFMLALAARPRNPGCKFDELLNLESDEGTGKSTALEILVGEDFFSDQTLFGKDDRQTQETVSGVWLHENSDLDGLKRADVASVKSNLSRKRDRARKAFGKVVERKPRRCVECGTTNDDEYLQSQTGNRRFWSVKVGTIDLVGLQRDRMLLLGEAASRQAAGESLRLDPSLYGAAGVEQAKRRQHDLWEHKLERIPSEWIHTDKAARQMVTTAELLEHVLDIPVKEQNGAMGRRLAHAMKWCGWNRNDGGRVQWSKDIKPARGFWRNVPSDEQPAQGGIPF